ncbi:MAG TPA: UdgX family uracil-DNA binding protein [Anaeromyxobacter sp.]|nr:UdgX family uracil-DNA binding protein [Anaeromyxobacter sp.]
MPTSRRTPNRGAGAGAGAQDASAFLPADRTLPALQAAARGCRGCPLWERGTQTVFGAGAIGAELVLVGEQPGTEEDLAGMPFVGPAGRLLDGALADAGIDRRRTYVTNAVKHFKWEPRGKKRIHQKPTAGEIHACSPWLVAELAVVQPRALLCLGATAAQALLGRAFRVTARRGELLTTPWAPLTMATVHPSSILRAPDAQTRRAELARFVEDLRVLKEAMERGTAWTEPAPP